MLPWIKPGVCLSLCFCQYLHLIRKEKFLTRKTVSFQVESSTGGRGTYPGRGRGTYPGWGEGYLPWPGEGYLPWLGGGVLTLSGGRGTYPGRGRGTYPVWGEGYLPCLGGGVPTLAGGRSTYPGRGEGAVAVGNNRFSLSYIKLEMLPIKAQEQNIIPPPPANSGDSIQDILMSERKRIPRLFQGFLRSPRTFLATPTLPWVYPEITLRLPVRFLCFSLIGWFPITSFQTLIFYQWLHSKIGLIVKRVPCLHPVPKSSNSITKLTLNKFKLHAGSMTEQPVFQEIDS